MLGPTVQRQQGKGSRRSRWRRRLKFWASLWEWPGWMGSRTRTSEGRHMVDVFGDKAREARLRCSGHQQTRDSEHISRWRRMIGAAEGNRRQTTAINNRRYNRFILVWFLLWGVIRLRSCLFFSWHVSKSYYNPFIKSCSTLLEFCSSHVHAPGSVLHVFHLISSGCWLNQPAGNQHHCSHWHTSALSSCPVHMQADGIGSIMLTYSLLLF